MNHDTFTPEEQALIKQLKSLPETELEQPTFDMIKQQMFHEMDYPSVPTSKPMSYPSLMMIVSITIIILLIVIAIVLVSLTIQNDQPKSVPTDITTQIMTSGPNMLQATEAPSGLPITQSPLPTSESATIPATETLTLVPAIAPATETPTHGTVVPSAITTTEIVAPLIIIEGPVEAININVIRVFDFDIHIDASDPILTDIQIGDNIRVEGNMNIDSIVAVNITIIDIDIFIGESGAASAPNAIPSGCKVTKKGEIKCSKKESKKSSKKS